MVFTTKNNIQSDFSGLLTWFLNSNSDQLARHEPWTLELIARNISNIYASINPTITNLREEEVCIDTLDEDFFDKDPSFLKPVENLQKHARKYLSEFLCDFLVHGSIATQDYSIGWSDLDTLLVVNANTLMEYQKLLRFRELLMPARKYLYQIDPLQHHEFIFCTEFDLSQYGAHCMPLSVLKNSRSLFDGTIHRISYNRDQAYLKFSCEN